MATARLQRRGGGVPVRRAALLLSLALFGALLVAMLTKRVHTMGGHSVVSDAQEAEALFDLARESANAADFAGKLQAAGLMPSSGSSSSGSTGGGAGGSSTGSSSGGSSSGKGSERGGSKDGKPSQAGGDSGSGKEQYRVPQLSRELAHKYARDGIIIVTWANFHFSDFVLNWVHHMGVHGITNYLVGAMDRETGQLLASRGLNVFAMYNEASGKDDTGLGTADFGWGSPTFHKMGRQKVDLARTFTGYDLDLCLCDVDTVWINDPTEYFERYPTAHILASSDDLSPSNPKGDDGLEQVDAIHSAMNIGLLFFRHGANTTRFIDVWQQRLDADSKAWDQNVFNQVAHDGLAPFESPPDQPRLLWTANHSVLIGILPIAQFASGHTFFVQRLFEYQQVKPYVVHTTFQYGGSSGKRHRLREAMLWVDPPEYYNEGRFLSVDLQYPDTPPGYQDHEKFMMEGQRFATTWKEPDMIDFHLKAVAQQLRQLRTALAVAVALNRTIIMPRLISWCDRYWGPVEFCQLPGAFKLRLPFVAPMDHWLEPFHFTDMADRLPAVPFREYSFLANERTPQALKGGRITVTPDAAATAAELKEGKGGKVLRIPKGQTDAQLRALLEPYKDAQLLHLSTAEGAFGRFEDREQGQRFQERVLHMAGFFCCKRVKEGEDGGVGYAQYFADPTPALRALLRALGGPGG